jgi:hypothetical protein
MKNAFGTGIILASVLGGICGSIATVALRSATAAAGPPPMTAPSGQTLANLAESRIPTIEATVAQLEKKVAQLEKDLSALKTAYAGHGHPYNAPHCGTQMTLTTFKQVLAGQPDAYTLCIIPTTASHPGPATTSKPVAAN